jgi:hypothetical protein
MKLRLENYKTYFIDRRAPDGSDNGGDWPDDERIYSFKVDGGDGRVADIPTTMTAKDLTASMSAPQAAGPTKPKVIATLRRVLGWFFLLFGAVAVVYVNTASGRQEAVCKGEFGACVWERIEPKLYVRERASGSLSEKASARANSFPSHAQVLQGRPLRRCYVRLRSG